MSSIPENIRLKELVIVANLNKPFFDDFTNFLQIEGYAQLYEFVIELDSSKAKKTIKKYLDRKVPNHLKLYVSRKNSFHRHFTVIFIQYNTNK